MTLSTRPLLSLYVVWHPKFAEGQTIAEALYDHYRSNLYENIAGGTGLSVVFRSTPAPESEIPIAIDFESADTSAIIVLLEDNIANSPAWTSYVSDLCDKAEKYGLGNRVFPVSIEKSVFDLNSLAEQAIRWDVWNVEKITIEESCNRLIRKLTYGFCRMLRHYLEHLKRPADEEEELLQYLKKVQIFLSHSKHDEDGERIAREIRDQLFRKDDLSSFFDVHDIPAGLRFHKVILSQVRTSAMAAIYTDSYSSREWCRKEIIEAKRHNVPLVVVNCINNIDERSFPYLGNVPVVRMDPSTADRVDTIVSRLLDEVLKDFLWKCRVEMLGDKKPETIFLPRQPELISLVNLPKDPALRDEITIVYPDPPLGTEEELLFENVVPNVRLRSLTEWLAEKDI